MEEKRQKDKATELLVEAKDLLANHTLLLPKEDPDLFLRSQEALRLFDPNRPNVSEEAVMRLLFEVYRTMGECEIRWSDYDVFANWAKRAYDVLPDPGGAWFNGKNKRPMTEVELDRRGMAREWLEVSAILLPFFLMGRCSAKW